MCALAVLGLPCTFPVSFFLAPLGPKLHTMRAPSCRMAETVPTSLSTAIDDPELIECIVDAEGYDQINACWAPVHKPVPPSPVAAFMANAERFFKAFGSKSPSTIDIDVEECIVFSENEAERNACMA